MTKADIEECINELMAEYREERDRLDGPRQLAWGMYVGTNSGSYSFWRHGFAKRFRSRLSKGADYTIIPDYDVIAQWVAAHYPEWEGRCGELWDFLLSPYEKRKTRKDFYEQAAFLVGDPGDYNSSTVCDRDRDWQETF